MRGREEAALVTARGPRERCLLLTKERKALMGGGGDRAYIAIRIECQGRIFVDVVSANRGRSMMIETDG